VTSDSLWYEGSFTYNEYVLSALGALFLQASLLGQAPALEREMLTAQNMLLAPIDFRFPDGNLPSPSDSTARLKAINRGLHASFRRVLPTRVGLIEAAGVKSWDTLVDPPETPLPLPGNLPAVVSRNFDGERMAILAPGHWQLFFHYGQLTQAHAQQEALSYEIYLDSSPVSLDQGTVSYGSQLHENYFRRGAAHNVPLVDGFGQNGWAPGTVLAFDAAVHAIEVSQAAYWANASATRRLEIGNETVSDKVTIKLNPSIIQSRRLGLVFNSECKFNFDDVNLGPSTSANAPVGAGFEYWSYVTQRSAPNQWSAQLICKDVRIRLTVSGSGPHQIFHASAPATPLPLRRESIYLEMVGREAMFEMQLQPEPR
jgi:hypothetical protein